MTTLGLIVLWVLIVALWLFIVSVWKQMTPNRATGLILTALLLTIVAGAAQLAAMTPEDTASSELAAESTSDTEDDEDPDEYADSDDEESDPTEDAAEESSDTDDEAADTSAEEAETDDTTVAATSSSTAPVASSSSVVAHSSSRYSHTSGTTHNPGRAGSNSGTRRYAYKPVPKTGDSQTVYVSANIPGRYHKDPHCRGLEQRGGRVAMTLAQARAKGYVAFCAYERYGN